jgi:hypothetical protein
MDTSLSIPQTVSVQQSTWLGWRFCLQIENAESAHPKKTTEKGNPTWDFKLPQNPIKGWVTKWIGLLLTRVDTSNPKQESRLVLKFSRGSSDFLLKSTIFFQDMRSLA